MIDPLLSLAFSLQSNHGVYAVLLGSGISRSAGIPTGWDVVLDLARKLASMVGEDVKDAPEVWYKAKYGRDPDYSELLDALCKTASERQQLLRAYFEASEEERDQGLKQPTTAHRAIAKLMANGYIRVALTTNFDRLLERAIEDEGVSPVVISTADSIEGAIPLAHQRCCVIKLHGDYLDTRIRNTPTEVAEYDPRCDKLLDQIFDQFGLIVCGWSAQWDVALRAAIERTASRRYTMYWASHGVLKDDAERLVGARGGVALPIADADSFFTKLADLVEAIDAAKTPHPASLTALVALTKRYLSDSRFAIPLSDLLHEEVEAARAQIDKITANAAQSQIVFDDLFRSYRGAIARVQVMLIHGCANGVPEHHRLWSNAIQRLGVMEFKSGFSLKDGIRMYPAVVLLYSAGLAALATGRVGTAADLLTKPLRRDPNEVKPLLSGSFWGEMSEFIKQMKEYSNRHVPKSEHLFVEVREPLRRYAPDDDMYERFMVIK